MLVTFVVEYMYFASCSQMLLGDQENVFRKTL
jgi:hypothetical protein